jgi:hypothetical protein
MSFISKPMSDRKRFASSMPCHCPKPDRPKHPKLDPKAKRAILEMEYFALGRFLR